MAAKKEAFGNLDRRNISLHPKSIDAGCLNGIAVGLLAVFLFAATSAGADEFDALAIYSEAQPLNDRWQACAASFVRPWLKSQKLPDALAQEALDSCRSDQERLRLFFAGKIGKRSAENVIVLLREKYQSDLIAAINELRTRN
ncbi:hypothetical protein [Microvirga subterranea]|uniref:hypothetical protein n=1 Tax=Microvirga subterranea TaxID=186651 RepID=UPI0011C02336|nr:hypothetical protein [Microvirga subterranea]